MTVLDEVLTAEKTSEQKLVEAKEAAVTAVLAAKKDQAEALKAEEHRLAEVEKTELEKHTKHVAEVVETITHDAQVKVQSIENAFQQKSTDIREKIKATFA